MKGGVSKKFRHIACGYSYQPFLVLWVYYKYFKGLHSCMAVSGLREEGVRKATGVTQAW
jgi:hypothetical protein